MAEVEPALLNIAIIGCGIGGLACAVALQDCPNISISMYESASQIAEIGVGMTLWPRTWSVLRKMGMEESIGSLLEEWPNQDPKVAFEFWMGEHLKNEPFVKLTGNGGTLPIKRSDLQQAFLNALPQTSPNLTYHLSHRLVTYTESANRVHLEFANGATATCDLLIGVDGIKSVVREVLLRQSPTSSSSSCYGADSGYGSSNLKAASDMVYTGSVIYRGLVPKTELARAFPGHRALDSSPIYCGKDKHVIAYPIERGEIVNVGAFISVPLDEGGNPPPGGAMSRDELVGMYETWDDEVKNLLKCIETPIGWPIYELKPLERYTSKSNRVVLLGDAAHAMTPHLGAGAGQAIEDAYTLGRILAATPSRHPDIVPSVLERYNAIRQPLGNRMLEASREEGLLYELNGPGFGSNDSTGGGASRECGDEDELDGKALEELGERILRGWEWAWSKVED